MRTPELNEIGFSSAISVTTLRTDPSPRKRPSTCAEPNKTTLRKYACKARLSPDGVSNLMELKIDAVFTPLVNKQTIT